jgi:thioesterase domain-containing protein
MNTKSAHPISTILKTIRPFTTLGIQLENESVDSLTMSIPLDNNLNDKNTMFAGSQYSVMVLCGWVLAYKILNIDAKNYDIVIKQSSVNYLFPVRTDARAVAELTGDIAEKPNRNRIVNAMVRLMDKDGKTCAEFNGEYIGIKIEP